MHTVTGKGKNKCMFIAERLEDGDQAQSEFMLTSICHRGGWRKDDFLNCLVEPGTTDYSFLIDSYPDITTYIPFDANSQYTLLGYNDIKNFHGSVSQWRGKWVVPTKHPQMILKGGHKEVPTSVFDINRAVELDRKGWKPNTVDYLETPTLLDLEKFINEYELALLIDPETFLSVDIETPNSREIDEDEREDEDPSYVIERISFSFRENHAITLPWGYPFLTGIFTLLSSCGPKLFWNGNKFDVPRLRFNGCTINGIIYDMMDGWHFLYPDLPKSLGYVSPFFTDVYPWKHLSKMRPEYYSCVDSDVALRNGNGIRRELTKLGMWHIFVRDLVMIEPIFIDLHNVGIGINEKRRSELRQYYEEIRDNGTKLIQEAVPEEARPWLKKEGYKGKPKAVRAFIQHSNACTDEEAWLGCGYQPDPRTGCEGRWNKRGDFNPNSPKQIIEYITLMYGKSAIPKNKKSDKDTTGADELERLAKQKKDKVLELIGDASNAGTKLSSFINNWKVGVDKKVHPTFTNTPSTFRLSSKNPNSQNFPNRSKEAKLMREMVVAGDGWKYLIESDFTGIEAILVGWYANDDQYIRLAKRGVHDFFSSQMMARDGVFEAVPLSLSDDDLTIALKEAKKVGNKLTAPGSELCYRDVAKQIVHGTNYREGAKLMHDSYPDCFPTIKIAKDLQSFYLDVFPKIAIWQNKVVDDAYDPARVVSAFGYHRRFYNVKKWAWNQSQKKWHLVWGEDAKKAIATIPQGSAAAIIRRAMLSEPYALLRKAKSAMIQVHDSLLNRARNERMRDWVIEQIIKAMVFPIPEMGGLTIPVEVKVGLSWGEMETIVL